ncbi:MAG: MHS family proline/betaine transporter-like MFS transporter [Candidatus Midichloriaceae bacterium]|jgi:MHS family proline/betaine transporter-like MFS transporter
MRKKNLLSSAIMGNIVEYYDFGIYAVFAELIAKIFFPNYDEYTGLLLSFAVFAVGFLMRPIGGIIFGHLGDQLGRKFALTISVVGMGLSTFAIGILPSYNSIGVLAPVLLTLIRMFQGLCIGGEGAGSAIFVIEHSDEKDVGIMGSIMMASNVAGTLLAIIAGLIIDHLFSINDTTWRYGFFFGAFLGVVGFYLRFKSSETPVFEKMKAEKKIIKFPIMIVLKEKWRSILITSSFAGLATSSTYMIRGFFGVYFSETLGFEKDVSLYIVLLALTFLVVSLPIFGFISDKIGYKKYIYTNVFIYLILIPIIFSNIANASGNLSSVLINVSLLSIIIASVVAPYYPFAIKFFTPELRYSAVASGWNLGNAIFGGTTPLISTLLVMHIGSTAPAYYLIFTALLFLVMSFLNRKFLHSH